MKFVSLSTRIPAHDFKVEQNYMGQFVETKQVARKGKLVKGQSKTTALHLFNTMKMRKTDVVPTGAQEVLWGTKVIDDAVAGKEGRVFRFSYNGKKKSVKNPGQTFHSFDIEIGEE